MRCERNCSYYAADLDVDRISTHQLRSVRSAVQAVLFTALVFSVGEARARGRDYDPQLWQMINLDRDIGSRIGDDPTTHDSGAWCEASGCYIWADPYDPMGGLGGGPGGGGTGGTGSSSGGSGPPPPPPAIPIMSVPDLDKVACVGVAYGNKAPKWGFAFNNIWAFAEGAAEVYSFTSSIPPVGFSAVSGDTWIGPSWTGGGTTVLYAEAVTSHRSGFTYYDNISKTNLVAPPPFSALEWAILTYAHEITHQNGMGTTLDDELKAEGYAYGVLKDFRDDGGKKCL